MIWDTSRGYFGGAAQRAVCGSGHSNCVEPTKNWHWENLFGGRWVSRNELCSGLSNGYVITYDRHKNAAQYEWKPDRSSSWIKHGGGHWKWVDVFKACTCYKDGKDLGGKFMERIKMSWGGYKNNYYERCPNILHALSG